MSVIYASLEPGLLVINSPQISRPTADTIAKALLLHRKMIDTSGAKVPMTKELLELVYDSCQIGPLEAAPYTKELRGLVLACLAKMVQPPLSTAGLNDVSLNPAISRPWIDEQAEEIWLDSLASALYDALTDKNLRLCLGFLDEPKTSATATIASNALSKYLNIPASQWRIPIVTNEITWKELICKEKGWPYGIDSELIDAYIHRNPEVNENSKRSRRKVTFSTSCLKELAKEEDPTIQSAIVEIIACRVYDRRKPHHRDEKVSSKKGIRRVSVKKMTPVVRFHYELDDDAVRFVLYSNGKHDKGL